MEQQEISSEVWDQYYRDYEDGAAVGIEYPTETLVRHVSNLRKLDADANRYFADKGRERSLKSDFTGNALEIGFGSVANLAMVRRKGFQAHGLEVSSEAVRRGRLRLEELGLPDVKLADWTPTDLPYQDNFFDLIYGLQCIYYNLELEKVIAEIYRAMAPGGHFMFSFFSNRHGYMEMIEQVEPQIYRWAGNHSNQRLVGAYFRQPQSREELASWFSAFANVNVFVWETDQLPVFQSWWYVTGQKPVE